MKILENARNKFSEICTEREISLSLQIEVRPLSAIEAAGDKLPDDFPIKKGKEQVIEAAFSGFTGQAFTDQPSVWSGTLEELLDLDLSMTRNRAVFIAGMNAVLSFLGLAFRVNHCQDDEPKNCGCELVNKLVLRFGKKQYGLIGLQPAILQNLVKILGPESVKAVDLNPDNIGQNKCNVEIWDGEKDLVRLARWCDVGLATGSSVVNGTIDEIITCFKKEHKPLMFFGNTIAGVSALLNLDRLCPFGR